MQALQEAASVESPGYVLYRPLARERNPPETPTPRSHADKVLEEFQPHYSNSTKVGCLSSTITFRRGRLFAPRQSKAIAKAQAAESRH
jgi:hypothetical protein